MGVCSYPHTEVADAFVAEARAYERALSFTSKMGFRRILVEGDSRTIINKLQAKKEDRFILRAIISNIKILESFMEEVSYHFLHREANMAAHIRTKEGR